ncbi:MAG TPA: ABC transporter substrate-binding protein [Polyangiales bacterium]|nr:ABC transporter substrate-binding protein [Polyangiales bacterium]
MLAACLAACTRGAPGYFGTTEPKHGPEEIWSNLSSEPEYIDPGKCADSPGGEVIDNLFSGLLQSHPATLEPMPDIAERWDVSEGGRRYTFHLRDSAWSDGVPLTAADFEYAWRRVLDPATGSKYATYLYPLRYAEQFNSRAVLVTGPGAGDEATLRAKITPPVAEMASIRLAPELGGAFVVIGGEEGERAQRRERVVSALNAAGLSARLTDATLVGVHAADPHTLVVDLEDPVPYFLSMIAYHTTRPVPRHVIERLAKAGQNTDLWTRPENIVSNGPYVLGESKFRQYMTLVKNPRYWDAAHVRTPKIRLSLIESYNTALNMYEAGELDLIGSNTSLPAEFMDRLQHYKDFQRAPSMITYLYWLNVKEPPLDDPRVRRALSMAVDRKSLVDHVTRAGQTASADLVPDGLGGYTGPHTPIYEPDKARALLAEAGYGPSHPLPRVTITYNTSEGHKQIAEAVQQMWRKTLGIEVEIENQEWKVFLKNLESTNFQVARMGWVGDYPDPYTFLELVRTGNGNNHSNWSYPPYDDLLRRANATQEPAARFALLKQAEQLVVEQVPVIPMYVYTRSEVTKPYLRGHVINYQTLSFYKYAFIDKRWYSGVPKDALPHGFPVLHPEAAR